MRGLNSNSISLFPGDNGDLQVVVPNSCGGSILIDAQGCEIGTDGRKRFNHGTVSVSYEVVRHLADFLGSLPDEPVDERQQVLPAIWSDSVTVQPVPRRHRRRAA